MGSGDLGGGRGVEFWRAEAECLAAENVVLRARVVELEGQVGALTEKVSMLARLAFGTSSEKATKPALGEDGTAGGASGEDAAGDDSAAGKPQRGRGQQRGSVGHGRRDYSHLPTREEIHDLGESERVCPRCGVGYVRFGEECGEQIDWQVQLTRIVHRRPAYRRSCRCPVRGVLVAPPVPKAIAKGRFTTGFLARLLVEKFVLGPARAPDRRRVGPRRIRPARGHPGRGVRSFVGPAGPAGGRDQRPGTPLRRIYTWMRRAGRCSPRCRARTVTAGGGRVFVASGHHGVSRRPLPLVDGAGRPAGHRHRRRHRRLA